MDDVERLLLEIKGDLGETFGTLSAVRDELREHRQEDIDRLDRLDRRLDGIGGRLGSVETTHARLGGAESVRRHGEARRSGIIAALVAGIIGIAGQFVAYIRH